MRIGSVLFFASALLSLGGTFWAPPARGQSAAPPVVKPKVLASTPHDPQAFTQGLLLHRGSFFESTGLNGRSSLREVTPKTGAVVRRVDLSREYFGEGLALVGETLIQLTWQSGVALRFDSNTFESQGSFTYQGEGWGLCYDGGRLVMSDGSGSLFFRDPKTFTLTGQVAVKLAGQEVTRLNELECVGSLVYANVWQTNTILRIDPKSGVVLTQIDASELAAEQRGADVLNGIAYDPATQHFFLTGKLWSKVYETKFAFNPGAVEAKDAGPELNDAAPPAASPETGPPAAAPKEGGAASDAEPAEQNRPKPQGDSAARPEPDKTTPKAETREAGVVSKERARTSTCDCHAAGVPGTGASLVAWFVSALAMSHRRSLGRRPCG